MQTDFAATPKPKRALAPVMLALREELARIVPLLGAAREVAYLDIPDHVNVGDRLIHAGTERFFRDHRVRVVYRCARETYNEGELVSSLGPDTVITLHGGGNFGTLWPEFQRFRERILARFPDRQIVVLPQSIHFEDDAARDASAALFRAHPRVAICVRDTESEAIARAYFSDTVLLVPDMAHALWGHLRPSSQVTTTVPLVLARRDKESGFGAEQAGSTDWLTFLNARDLWVRAFLKEQFYRAERWQTRIRFVPAPWRFIALDGAYLIRKAVRLFSPHGEIRTDRLHAMILACLLQRRLGYVDNSYGKLSRYVDAWLSNVDTISRIEPSAAGAQQGTGPAH